MKQILFLLTISILFGCRPQNKSTKRDILHPEMTVSVHQITSGPANHFFGYIGHAVTIPWNAGGRYIVALESDFFERMPEPGEAVRIILLDTQDKYRKIVLDSTLAWNLQQGTMLYWNPEDPENQYFFNDLDPARKTIFTVLYDIGERRRVKVYNTENQYVANSGVSPAGKWFAGVNYARVSMRKVVSYADAVGWADRSGNANPDDDGLYRIDIGTGESKLLVSYKEIARFLNIENAGTYPLYVHHTLWNRDGDRIFFVVRGGETVNGKKYYPNEACLIRADGTGLKLVPFTNHREWGEGKNLVLASDNGYELFDVDQDKVVGRFGSKEIFPEPTSDNVLSPDAEFYVASKNPGGDSCIYTFFRFADGAFIDSPPVRTRGNPEDHDVRMDPAPRWNRTSDALLVSGIADDGTQQLFEVRIALKEK